MNRVVRSIVHYIAFFVFTALSEPRKVLFLALSVTFFSEGICAKDVFGPSLGRV